MLGNDIVQSGILHILNLVESMSLDPAEKLAITRVGPWLGMGARLF